MLIAAIISGFIMGFSPAGLIRVYGQTIWVVRYSLITIAAMLAIGTLTRYSGVDATLGLAFANAGFFYPFFGTLLGWLGVALTGSDTASNGLFGGLQKITAQQLGLSPILMGAANSVRRRDGQDDRCPVHRGGLHSDQLVWSRRVHPAVRVLPLHRVGLPGRRPGHAAGLSADRHGRAVEANTQ